MNLSNKNKSSQALWLWLFSISFFSLLYSHFFLQHYLFMQPCEQCVYVRFAFSVILCASIVGYFKFAWLKSVAYAFIFWAIFLGFKACLMLLHSYEAIKTNNPFGINACSDTPHFPFKLPLHELLPSLFAISGSCGFDAPRVSENTQLSSIQEFFIGTLEHGFSDGLYSKGWYLIPSFEFVNMATACMIIFGFFLLLSLFNFVHLILKEHKFGLFAFCLTISLIFLA
ncbi:disulfide bond formation protein B [Campylobacter sp. MIT 97-5078]|uniref:disulfide bond formation protein B n=1 Tax=Campylobacter sp. MIT 97-5078 TaxID=1548153 RepID=UPI00068B8050|nr:disulfide bond formation protein B [Campylobacter sp. MIT 97-5078]TQR27591.1 disulfide bond formation protein B [Campylobacter sp. MIT 97-5078]